MVLKKPISLLWATSTLFFIDRTGAHAATFSALLQSETFSSTWLRVDQFQVLSYTKYIDQETLHAIPPPEWSVLLKALVYAYSNRTRSLLLISLRGSLNWNRRSWISVSARLAGVSSSPSRIFRRRWRWLYPILFDTLLARVSAMSLCQCQTSHLALKFLCSPNPAKDISRVNFPTWMTNLDRFARPSP